MIVLIALFCFFAGVGNLFTSTVAFSIRFGLRHFVPSYYLPPARPRLDYFVKGIIYIAVAILLILIAL
jgi:hypothetical protein